MKNLSDYIDKYVAIACFLSADYLLWGWHGLGIGLFMFALGYGISRLIEHS